jgi:uncharacterized protein (TIGR03437 family)
LIFNENSSANSSTNPSSKGSQIVFYATGDGDTTPGIVAGALITRPSPRSPNPPISVTIGGIAAEVTYAGMAPGLYGGILQVNVRLPGNIPSGNVPLVLTVGGASSPSGVTVAVK